MSKSVDKEDFEIELIRAQTNKLLKETRWYEVALFFGAGSAFTLALLSVAKWLML